MKTAIAVSAIASVAVATTEDNLPKLKDKCCTPLSEIPVTKPTTKWVCGKLQDTYN